MKKHLLTQNNVPNEAHSDRQGHKTPTKASHGLLKTGSRFNDVTIVNTTITLNVIDIRGKAFTPKLLNINLIYFLNNFTCSSNFF